MAQPPHTGGKRGIVPDFGQLELPAGYRYTTLWQGKGISPFLPKGSHKQESGRGHAAYKDRSLFLELG